MKLLKDALSGFVCGATAVYVLHVEASPSYLMLFIGWVALFSAIESAVNILDEASQAWRMRRTVRMP